MKHSFVFAFYDRRSECGLFRIVKSEFFERFAHGAYPDAVVVRYKGRSDAHDNGISALQKNFYVFGFIDYFFRVLRTDNETLSAKDTFVSDNMRLVSRKSDRFYGAMPDALVAVFAV